MHRSPKAKLTLTNLEDRLTPAGWLDPNFGIGGIATTGLPSFGTGTPLIAAQADGKLIVAGFENDTQRTSVVRLNADGSIDSTFGNNGKTELRSDRSFPDELRVTASGEIYVLDALGSIFGRREFNDPPVNVLYRMTADGRYDASFDGDGMFDVSGAAAFEPQADGSVVVAYPFTSLLIEYTRTGEWLGTTELQRPPFGFNGNRNSWYQLIDVQSTLDGGLLTFGVSIRDNADGKPVVVVSKTLADGTLDENYGENGFAAIPFPTNAGSDVSVVPLGTDASGAATFALSVKQASWNSSPTAPPSNEVVKLTAAGQLDTNFAGDGIAELGTPDGATIDAGQLLPDGRIVLAARMDDTLLVRTLTAAGTADASVADGGWLVVADPRLANAGFGYDAPFQIKTGFTTVVLPGNRFGVLSTGGDDPILATIIDLNAVTPTGSIIAAGDPTYAGPSRGLIPVAPRVGDPVPPPTSPEPVLSPGLVPEPVPVSPDGRPASETIFRSPTPPQATPIFVSPESLPVPGDFNGDRVADTIVVDGPLVSIVSGKDGSAIIKPFAPFEAAYTGSLNAIAIDVNWIGYIDRNDVPELVVAPTDGGGPIVAVYDATGKQLNRFFGLEDRDFRGGLGLAAGGVGGNGLDDLVVTAGAGGGPRVAIFDGSTLGGDVKKLMADFFAFEAEQRAGVSAWFRDGIVMFGAGPGGAPRLRGISTFYLSGATKTGELATESPDYVGFDRFFGDPTLRNGVQVDVESFPISDTGDSFAVKIDDGSGNRTEFKTRWGKFYVPGIDAIPTWNNLIIVD